MLHHVMIGRTMGPAASQPPSQLVQVLSAMEASVNPTVPLGYMEEWGSNVESFARDVPAAVESRVRLAFEVYVAEAGSKCYHAGGQAIEAVLDAALGVSRLLTAVGLATVSLATGEMEKVDAQLQAEALEMCTLSSQHLERLHVWVDTAASIGAQWCVEADRLPANEQIASLGMHLSRAIQHAKCGREVEQLYGTVSAWLVAALGRI